MLCVYVEHTDVHPLYARTHIHACTHGDTHTYIQHTITIAAIVYLFRSLFKQLLSTSSDPHVLLKDIVVSINCFIINLTSQLLQVTLYEQISARGGSLFLVDFITRELYAKVFEPSIDNMTQISANKLVLMKDMKAPPK